MFDTRGFRTIPLDKQEAKESLPLDIPGARFYGGATYVPEGVLGVVKTTKRYIIIKKGHTSVVHKVFYFTVENF